MRAVIFSTDCQDTFLLGKITTQEWFCNFFRKYSEFKFESNLERLLNEPQKHQIKKIWHFLEGCFRIIALLKTMESFTSQTKRQERVGVGKTKGGGGCRYAWRERDGFLDLPEPEVVQMMQFQRGLLLIPCISFHCRVWEWGRCK